MIGRDVEAQFPPKPPLMSPEERGKPLLKVHDLKWETKLNGIDLTVCRGEIVGLGGLDGQGQKELLLALFGALRDVDGDVTVGGRKGIPSSPASAKSAATRMALVPEDRKTEGLMLGMRSPTISLPRPTEKSHAGRSSTRRLPATPFRTASANSRSRSDRKTMR